MPIQRPSERQQHSALELFTNRDEFIAAFERSVACKKPEEHRVLVFYGDGGIGKTLLLAKLEQLHRERNPEGLIGRLDFAGADVTPPDVLLYRLRRVFRQIPFPSFSLALSEYARRFGRSRCTEAIARSCFREPDPMPMCWQVGWSSWRR